MADINKFKNFVRNNPSLITNVKNNKMTWQKYYELYDLYGEDENIWEKYILKDEEKKVTDTPKFNDFLDMAKKIDVDKVQNGISSLQKAIELFGDLVVGKNSNSSNNYTPKPVYRRFDD